jgi:hypothetical protein
MNKRYIFNKILILQRAGLNFLWVPQSPNYTMYEYDDTRESAPLFSRLFLNKNYTEIIKLFVNYNHLLKILVYQRCQKVNGSHRICLPRVLLRKFTRSSYLFTTSLKNFSVNISSMKMKVLIVTVCF